MFVFLPMQKQIQTTPCCPVSLASVTHQCNMCGSKTSTESLHGPRWMCMLLTSLSRRQLLFQTRVLVEKRSPTARPCSWSCLHKTTPTGAICLRVSWDSKPLVRLHMCRAENFENEPAWLGRGINTPRLFSFFFITHKAHSAFKNIATRSQCLLFCLYEKHLT